MAYEVRLAVGAVEWLMEQKDLLTHRELCRVLDITPAQFSQIINGHRKLSASFLLGVWKAYGIGMDHEIYQVVRKADRDASVRLFVSQQNRQPFPNGQRARDSHNRSEPGSRVNGGPGRPSNS